MASIKLKLTCINTGVRRISVIMITGQGHKTFRGLKQFPESNFLQSVAEL